MAVPERLLSGLDRVIERIHADDPTLDAIWLEPDDQFQLRGMALDAAVRETTECLAGDFRARHPSDFPMLYCAWGKARVGSTALNNLFGVAGLPSYYQPVKAVLRLVVAGAPRAPWRLPSTDAEPQLFCKETQGPYFLGECLFVPLRVLVEAGFPPDRLHLIMLDRDPARSLASWLNKLSHLVPHEILMRHYVIAALNARRVERYARAMGIPVTHYVYEASREPVTAAAALFRRLGLFERFSDDAVTGWGERGALASAEARIIYPDQPAIYDVPGLHGSDTGYRFRNGGTSLTDAQLEFLGRSGVEAVYRAAVDACIADLGLEASAAARLFGNAATPRQASAASWSRGPD
jgi:hypothetical protein